MFRLMKHPIPLLLLACMRSKSSWYYKLHACTVSESLTSLNMIGLSSTNTFRKYRMCIFGQVSRDGEGHLGDLQIDELYKHHAMTIYRRQEYKK